MILDSILVVLNAISLFALTSLPRSSRIKFIPMAEYGVSPSASLDASACRCPKCDCVNDETGQVRVSGGFWSIFYDVGN